MNIPNRITLLRIIMVAIFLAVYYIGFQGWSLVCAIVFFLASLTDIFDGHIARKKNLVTDLGKFLDPIADKLIVTAALIVLLDIQVIPSIFVIIIIAREFIVSALRMLAATQGEVLAAGVLGKIKTVLQMTAILVYLMDVAFALPELLHNIGFILMSVAIVMTVWSGIDYVVRNRYLLKQKA